MHVLLPLGETRSAWITERRLDPSNAHAHMAVWAHTWATLIWDDTLGLGPLGFLAVKSSAAEGGTGGM